MGMARQIAIAVHRAEALKRVVSVEGIDFSGVDLRFHVAEAPEAAPLIHGTAHLLSVLTTDGVPTSVIEIIATPAQLAYAATVLGIVGQGGDVTVYYELRAASVPGDVGTPAETTLLYGPLVLRGSIG